MVYFIRENYRNKKLKTITRVYLAPRDDFIVALEEYTYVQCKRTCMNIKARRFRFRSSLIFDRRFRQRQVALLRLCRFFRISISILISRDAKERVVVYEDNGRGRFLLGRDGNGTSTNGQVLRSCQIDREMSSCWVRCIFYFQPEEWFWWEIRSNGSDGGFCGRNSYELRWKLISKGLNKFSWGETVPLLRYLIK